jgi:elongation factor G
VSIDLSKVRNIGIAAHIDAGKTTTTERVLYYTGKTHKMGQVDEGTTVTDFDAEEQQRGITIYSAAVSCPWRDHTINLIDTPGHVDFTAEVERALRVLDGAVVVFDAKEGVEAQSETVWRQAAKYRVPTICFINKMDKLGADFGNSFKSIRDRLGARPVAVQIPIGSEGFFEGVVDLMAMKAVYYFREKEGSVFEERDIPVELEEVTRRARRSLEEQVADTSESIMEKFIEDEPIETDELRAALREATIHHKLQPVFCGSALNYIGVQRLLDGVVDYLPCPLDMPPVIGHKVDNKGALADEISLPCDSGGPLVAYVFKIIADKPMDLFFVRVYSGTLKSGSRVFNPLRKKKENISRMFRIFAKKREQIDKAGAGDIIAVIGLKESLTGDTLCDSKAPIALESIEFPETVISMSIEPQSSADRDKLTESLVVLGRENPTFRYQINEETGQTIISGMGELHLEVLVNRLKRDMNVAVRVGKPRVSYRETVSDVGEYEEEFNRQIGGRGHFAKLKLRVEPYEPEAGSPPVVFFNRVSSETLESEYLDAIKTACLESSTGGVLAGYPMLNVKVTLLEAQQHEVDSSVMAFEAAARIGFDRAAEAASPTLMEPIMKVQIVTPETYFGIVSGDLSRRRAVVTDTKLRGDQRVIDATAPLKEMFGYATDLRSLTQGRSSWTMEPSHYQVLPKQIANDILGL